MTDNGPKINNRTLFSLLIAFIIIIAVWLIGYFTGIDEGNKRAQNEVVQKEIDQNNAQKTTTETAVSNLPRLPQVSEKSAVGKNLPRLPKLP